MNVDLGKYDVRILLPELFFRYAKMLIGSLGKIAVKYVSIPDEGVKEFFAIRRLQIQEDAGLSVILRLVPGQSGMIEGQVWIVDLQDFRAVPPPTLWVP